MQFYRCRFVCNQAYKGGAIAFMAGGSEPSLLETEECLLDENTAHQAGGGIYCTGSMGNLILQRTTVSGNRASTVGGGIFSSDFSSVSLHTSTFYHNHASAGAEIRALDTSVALNYVTLVAADPLNASNPSLFFGGSWSSLHLYDTILWGNCQDVVLSGTSKKNMGDPLRTCGLGNFDILVDTDPLLRPLANYGGPTPTAPPAYGSVAIDPPWNLTNCPWPDQRGVDRPQDGNGDGVAKCDIGAVEVRPLDLRPWWLSHHAKIELINFSESACDHFKNGVITQIHVELYVLDESRDTPWFWDEFDFDGPIGPGESDTFSFDWPMHKEEPGANARLFWTLTLTLEVPGETATEAVRGYRPTPPPTPQNPQRFTLWAFDTDTPRFREQPPQVPVDVDENHRRATFFLFGPGCPESPVGRACFHVR